MEGTQLSKWSIDTIDVPPANRVVVLHQLHLYPPSPVLDNETVIRSALQHSIILIPSGSKLIGINGDLPLPIIGPVTITKVLACFKSLTFVEGRLSHLGFGHGTVLIRLEQFQHPAGFLAYWRKVWFHVKGLYWHRWALQNCYYLGQHRAAQYA